VNVNLGVCAHNLGKKSESVRYLIDALDVARNNKDDLAQARINNILAVTYYQNKDMYNAAEFSLDAINAAEKSGNNQEKKEVYLTYSSILQSLEDYQKALDYFKKHLLIRDSLLVEQRITDQKSEQRIAELERLEKELRLKLADEEVQNVLLGQMKLESEKKEQELELYRREQELKSAENERMMQSLAYEKQKRQAVIREQQIKALEQENEIRNLELERKKAEEQQQKKNIALLQAEREKQSLEIEKQAEKEKTFYYIVIFGFLIFILILLFLINSRKKNKRLAMQKTMIEQSNHELNQLNEEISSQKENLVVANNKMVVINREITDSIRYAKRIQKSVLKSPEVLGAGISDYFIYFKPKDIVSGDFYWSKRIGNKTIIAAADCTGHGVPGAFMSMLGISFLNEIAGKQNNLDNAAVILDELREKVKESLQQTGKKNEQKDGMDIALIIIDPPKNQLHFAGANNPMLIIRKNELVEIKGDRMPIGIHHKEANFKNNTLEIKKGDVIYTYSDGFQDQFGGSAGRKFMTRRFREFLVSINEYPMPQQSELIQQTYDEWVSHPNPTGENFPQMDDILIIGLKIE